jgi:hypothetical protein
LRNRPIDHQVTSMAICDFGLRSLRVRRAVGTLLARTEPHEAEMKPMSDVAPTIRLQGQQIIDEFVDAANAADTDPDVRCRTCSQGGALYRCVGGGEL